MRTITATDLRLWRGPHRTAEFCHARRKRDTASTSIGRMVEAMLAEDEMHGILVKRCSWSTLEGKEEMRRILAAIGADEPAKLSAAYVDAAIADAGYALVTEDDEARARRMAAAYRDWPGVPEACRWQVPYEQSQDEFTWVARADMVASDGALIELKCTHYSDARHILRHALDDGWHVQLALLAMLSGADDVRWHVISSTEPHMVYELIPSAEVMALGKIEVHTRTQELLTWYEQGCPVRRIGGTYMVTPGHAGPEEVT